MLHFKIWIQTDYWFLETSFKICFQVISVLFVVKCTLIFHFEQVHVLKHLFMASHHDFGPIICKMQMSQLKTMNELSHAAAYCFVHRQETTNILCCRVNKQLLLNAIN